MLHLYVDSININRKNLGYVLQRFLPPTAECGDLKSPKDGFIVKGLVRLILGDSLLSTVDPSQG